MIQFAYKYDFQRLPGNKEDDMKTLVLKIRSEVQLSHSLRPYSHLKWQAIQMISNSKEKNISLKTVRRGNVINQEAIKCCRAAR